MPVIAVTRGAGWASAPDQQCPGQRSADNLTTLAFRLVSVIVPRHVRNLSPPLSAPQSAASAFLTPLKRPKYWLIGGGLLSKTFTPWRYRGTAAADTDHPVNLLIYPQHPASSTSQSGGSGSTDQETVSMPAAWMCRGGSTIPASFTLDHKPQDLLTAELLLLSPFSGGSYPKRVGSGWKNTGHRLSLLI